MGQVDSGKRLHITGAVDLTGAACSLKITGAGSHLFVDLDNLRQLLSLAASRSARRLFAQLFSLGKFLQAGGHESFPFLVKVRGRPLLSVDTDGKFRLHLIACFLRKELWPGSTTAR
ncbi:MAG: hypothetical protein GVY10_11925 [Verrucomicrobia bacterium]|jgi:hypothetical protein|nr:hypothetical protein [Verrucomicrobiota bacterium]